MICIANPNSVRLGCNPVVADIDIAVARGEICAAGKPNCNVPAPGGILPERTTTTDGNVAAAGGVVLHRSKTDDRVAVAGVVIEGIIAKDGVKGAIAETRTSLC
jgi:hypothetical protein